MKKEGERERAGECGRRRSVRSWGGSRDEDEGELLLREKERLGTAGSDLLK